jgi:glycine/D-amino acid oxidase-like deaminating enzyme
MDEWRRLEGAVPGLNLNWCGSLVWDLPADELRAFVAERRGQGYGIRLVEQDEAAALEPALLQAPELAAHAPTEGAVEPLEAALALLSDAQRRGTRLAAGQAVDHLLEAGGSVTGLRLADGTKVRGDTVVLAAGVATAALAAQLGVDVPVDDPPGLLVSTQPVAPMLKGLVVGPGLELRQLRDGRLLGSGHYAGSDPGADPAAVAQELLASVRSAIRGGDALRLHDYTIGHRPVPRDGFPIVGRAMPGLHVAVTHSGVTLAPALGRFLAEEVLQGRRDPLLDPFGLERFAA